MNAQPLDLKAAELLHLIDEGTASVTGDAFFRALVRKLSEGMQTRYTFVAEFDPALTRASVLAWWDNHGRYREPFTFPLKGTPCELVANGTGDIVSYEADVAVCFPEDRAALERIGAKSYVAVPLMRPDGRVMGHLAVFDDRERVWDPMSLGLLRIFAARATAEVERRQFEQELESANAALERRVSERTAELAETVQRLNAEIERRREVEQRLIHNEAEIRNLFDESPAALWVSDFSAAKLYIDQLHANGVTDLREYFRDRPALLHRAVEMQQVQTVNKATLQAYEGTAVEQFFHLQPDDLFTPEAYAALGEMVLRFAEGAIEYHTEATDRTLAGNVRDRYMKWRLMPGREHDWSRVLVAVLDISEQKEAARFLKSAHDELEQRVHERTTALFVANSKLQQEVAKRTQTERALRTSEKAFRDLYEEAPSVYWSVSADGTIMRANRRATELFGYSQEEIVGMRLFDLISDSAEGKPVAQIVRDKLLARDRDVQSGSGVRCKRWPHDLGIRFGDSVSERRRRNRGHSFDHHRHHRTQADGDIPAPSAGARSVGDLDLDADRERRSGRTRRSDRARAGTRVRLARGTTRLRMSSGRARRDHRADAPLRPSGGGKMPPSDRIGPTSVARAQSWRHSHRRRHPNPRA